MVLNGSWQGLGSRHSRTLLRQEYLNSGTSLSFQQWLLTSVREHTVLTGSGPYSKASSWQPAPPPAPVVVQVAAKSMPLLPPKAASAAAPATPPKAASAAAPATVVLPPPKAASAAAPVTPPKAASAAAPATPPKAATVVPPPKASSGVVRVEIHPRSPMARATFTSNALAHLFSSNPPPALNARMVQVSSVEVNTVYIQWLGVNPFDLVQLTEFLIQWVTDKM